MTKNELKYNMYEDYRRAYEYDFKLKRFLKGYFLDPGYKYLVWHRLNDYCRENKKKVLGLWCKFRTHRQGVKAGIDISCESIGSGLTISHFSCIFVYAQSIGSNCSLRQGVTVGAKNCVWGGRLPIIGNNVEFGAGCKVIGEVTIGNNVIIGANTVVTHDIPNNCVVAGVPGKVIKRI